MSMPSESLRYFLVIEGVDGGSTNARYPRSFELNGFEFDIDALANGADFSPLSVAVAAGNASDELTALLLAGTEFSVRLVGATTGQQDKLVYDLRLAGAKLTTLHEQSGVASLTLSFEQVTLTNYTQTEQGTYIPETTGWDLVQDIALTTALTPAAVAGNDNGQAGPAADNIRWFLTLADIDGGSLVDTHAGAFELSAFDFAMALKSGKAGVDPLTVFTNLGSAADEILKLIASGGELDPDGLATAAGARIVGVRRGSETVAPFYDLRLGEVTFASLARSMNTENELDTLQLDFTRFSLTTRGAAGSPETVSFDRKSGEQGTIQLTAPLASDEDTSSSRDLTYYLYLDGIDGGSNAEGHRGAFEINGFDFDARDGGRKPVFEPVTIDFHASSDVTRLMELIESGKTIASARIVGDRPGEEPNLEVLDLRLSGVSIRSLLQDGLGSDLITLGFKAYTLTTENNAGVPETTGWDIRKDKALTEPLAPAQAQDDNGGMPSDNSTFYLMIDGLDGRSDADGHDGAFEIENFSLGMKGGSKSKAGSVDIEFGNGAALSGLMEYAATAKKIGSAQIIAVSDGDDPQTYYDLRLGNLQVALLLEKSDLQHDHVSLSFRKYSVTTVDADDDQRTFAYDIAADKELKKALGEASPGDIPGATGARDYFMTIDGLDGGSRSDFHNLSFELEDFGFAFSRNAKLPRFEVTFSIGTSADEFTQMIAEGKTIENLRIVGDVPGDGVGSNPYDLRFANVRFTAMNQSAIDHDTITFTFDKFSLTTASQNEQGNLGTPRTTGFDFRKDAAIKNALDEAQGIDDDGGGGARTVDGVKNYLLLDGMDGGSRLEHLQGAFQLDEFLFDITRMGKKAHFEPITLTFHAGGAADELFALIANGLDLDAVQIVSVKPGTEPFTFFDLRLADVTLTAFDQIYDKAGNRGEEVVELTFGALSVTAFNQLQTGTVTEETYSYDLRTNGHGTDKLPEAVPELI
jgi:type VI protein secretion system component Hcp